MYSYEIRANQFVATAMDLTFTEFQLATDQITF